MKTWAKRIAIAGVLIVLAIAGVEFARRNKGSGPEMKYISGTVGRGDVRAVVTATGIIQPWKIIDVKSDVAGKIIKLAVDLGYRVKKGQLIADIDPTDTNAADQQAEGSLNSDKAAHEKALTSVIQQRLATQAQVAAAKQALHAAQAKELQAKAESDTQPALTSAAIAQANAAVSAANRTLTQAQQAKQQLTEQLSTLQEVTIPLNIQTVDATRSQAAANLTTAKQDYSRQRGLLAEGYVAQADLESSQSRLATAQSAVQTADQRKKTLLRENDLAVADMKSHIDQAQSQIDAETAHVAQAKAALDTANQNSVQNEVAHENYLAAIAAVKQAQADLASAVATYPDINMKKNDVQAAAASIYRDQAAVTQARINKTYTHVTAPSNGIVVTKTVEQGTVVPSSKSSVGTTGALVQLGDDSRMWCVCQVDETDIAQVHVGQKVTVKIDAYPDQPVAGFVYRIDPAAVVNQNVTTVPVTVQILHPNSNMKHMMNATCDFLVGEAKDVLTVPSDAVKGSSNKPYVQVLVKNVPQRVNVKLGLAGRDVTEVKKGLTEGQVVVIRAIPTAQGPQSPNNPLGFGGGRPNNKGGRR